jgi:hypothetical protein
MKVLSPLIPLSNQIISRPDFSLFERGRSLGRGYGGKVQQEMKYK